jgi:hypothetical protein
MLMCIHVVDEETEFSVALRNLGFGLPCGPDLVGLEDVVLRMCTAALEAS